MNDPIFVEETGCNLRELRVLRLIADNPGTGFAEIARMTGLERSLTSRLIQKLLKCHLIERQNSEEDARIFQLFLTEAGRKVRARGREVSDRLEALLTKPLDPDELTMLNSYLTRLAQWIDAPEYRQALSAEAEAMGSKDI